MKSQFTKKRLKKFLSYYRPYRNIFVMDMFFAALSAIATLLFPFCPVTLQDSDIVKIS